jgi:hypothetical protein
VEHDLVLLALALLLPTIPQEQGYLESLLLTLNTRYCATPSNQDTHNVTYRKSFQETEHYSSFSDYLLPFESCILNGTETVAFVSS